ncbi:MAG: VapC-like toxin [Thermoprotei archaeon]|nr:MAG: VapC-like toxin [Thermoprotei archaeon]
MRSLLKGRRVYIDTNIFIYVAVRHPDFYTACREVLEALVEEEYAGYGSQLVLFELFGSLSKVSVEAAYEASMAYLDLPLRILHVDRRTLLLARDVAELSHATYDAVHAALAARGGVQVVVTEDLDNWGRIASIWGKVRRRHGVGELTVVSPTRGILGEPSPPGARGG